MRGGKCELGVGSWKLGIGNWECKYRLNHKGNLKNMNHLVLIAQVIKKLESVNQHALAREVADVQSAASTGGELISSVCGKLLEIKAKNPTVFSEIRDNVDALLKYANSFGISPEWNGLGE